jgi:hypothetical protein
LKIKKEITMTKHAEFVKLLEWYLNARIFHGYASEKENPERIMLLMAKALRVEEDDIPDDSPMDIVVDLFYTTHFYDPDPLIRFLPEQTLALVYQEIAARKSKKWQIALLSSNKELIAIITDFFKEYGIDVVVLYEKGRIPIDKDVFYDNDFKFCIVDAQRWVDVSPEGLHVWPFSGKLEISGGCNSMFLIPTSCKLIFSEMKNMDFMLVPPKVHELNFKTLLHFVLQGIRKRR